MIWENEKKLLENAYVSYKNNNLQESLDTLNNLLDEILLVDKTLDDLNKLKKGFMQNMFI